MAKPGKINVTKDYGLFTRSADNRPTDIKKHKKLQESLSRYGFLKCFPVVCRRDEGGRLVVKDGQHRLMIAQTLGLPVYWIEEETDFDIAVINCASRTWVLRDYAEKFAANGTKAYQDGLDFAKEYGIPLGMAFALLAGTTSFGNCQETFVSGEFRVKDRKWAESVARIYGPLTTISPAIRTANFLLACMAVCRVPGFEPARLLDSADKHRSRLVAYAHRDDYLTVLEEIYNYKRLSKSLFPLKLEASKVMRERSVAGGAKKKTKEPVAA